MKIQQHSKVVTFGQKIAVGAGLVAGAAVSQAADGPDVSSVISALTTAATTVGTVCAAALGVVVVVKVFKYIRSAL